MGFSSARSDATSALMIAFVSSPVARPPIDCRPAPAAVWVRSVVGVGVVVVGVVDVELPIDVTIGHRLWGLAFAAASPSDAPAKGGGVASPTAPVVHRPFRPKN